MFKNVASQKVRVFAFDATTNLPKSGDAANISAYISKDFGAVTQLTDTSATEEDATNAKGYYLFDITQTETNADSINVTGKSSTANIVVIGVPAHIYTVPANFTAFSLDSSGRVDAIKINSVSASSVTAINANLGTTQPVNFTGTGASALAKSDMVDIAGAAVSTSSAQIGVNAVQAGATAWGSGAITAGSIAASALNGKGDWNIGKTGYALSSAGIQAIWDALTSALTTVGSIGKLLVDNINATISSRAAAGDAMTLTSGERDSIATAHLDLADGVESGITVRQGHRINVAASGGKLSGAATTNILIRDTNDTKNRINATVDADGNRTAVTLDVS